MCVCEERRGEQGEGGEREMREGRKKGKGAKRKGGGGTAERKSRTAMDVR